MLNYMHKKENHSALDMMHKLHKTQNSAQDNA